MNMEYSNTQMQALISEYIHSERNREILTARLIHGRTYETIAEEFDLTPRQIYRIVSRDAAKLYRHLQESTEMPQI